MWYKDQGKLHFIMWSLDQEWLLFYWLVLEMLIYFPSIPFYRVYLDGRHLIKKNQDVEVREDGYLFLRSKEISQLVLISMKGEKFAAPSESFPDQPGCPVMRY
jgi:hypothetical protein